MKNFVLLALIVVIGLAILLLAGTEREERPDPVPSSELEVRYEGEGIEAHGLSVIKKEDGEVLYEITIEELQNWMRDNWEVFEEPPEVALRPVEPENFTFFDPSAILSPDGKKLVFSVHDYSALTTLSFVLVADIDSSDLSVVKEPTMGSVEKFIWSADSKLVAYALGTARAGGDFLSVDDTEELEKRFTLSENEILEAIGTDFENGDGFMPCFRDLEWKDDRLHFTTDSPHSAKIRWSINRDGENLVTSAGL